MDCLTLPLAERHGIPQELADSEPRRIRDLFPVTTLIHVEGRAGTPLFLSLLLHGNETTGFYVLQKLQTWIRQHGAPPRPLVILIGNVEACEQGLRHLPQQPDYNRIWDGGELPEHRLAETIIGRVRTLNPFAAIDIHNNTGTNPLYACVNRLEPEFLHLASLFSPTIVHFESPSSVLAIAMSSICPSTTIEAGKPADLTGIEHAFQLVVDTLHLHAFRNRGLDRAVSVYRTMGRVEIKPDRRACYMAETHPDLLLPTGMENWNFCEQPIGNVWGSVLDDGDCPVTVYDNDRRDVTGTYFSKNDGLLRQVRPVTPSMLTRDLTVMHSDCMGYLMDAVELPPALTATPAHP